MGSYVPVMNESMNEIIYEMNHILKSTEAMILAVNERNLKGSVTLS